jgi:phage-related baseplate assembly protein
MPARGDMAPMRFVSPDLAGLPPPPAVEALDFEALLAARLADLDTLLGEAGLDDIRPVLALEGEPLVIAQQVGAAFELAYRQRINDAVRGVLWATAVGGQMDHLAATFYGIARLIVVPADPGAVPPVLEVKESDDAFRARGLLSLEARSTAGPEGAYIYFAVQNPAVKDAAVYGEEDGAYYGVDAEDLVLAPEVLVVILAQAGDGTADAPLRAAVLASLNAEEIRPIGDKVVVEAASILKFSAEGVIRYAAGADPAPLIEAAQAQAQAYCDARHKVGRNVQRLGIGAAMKVTDVEEIELVLKDENGDVIVGDIVPGPKGAAYCTGIAITAAIMTDSWS